MKKKYKKIIEGYAAYLTNLNENLEKNNGFLKLKADRLVRCQDPMNKAFLSLKKEKGTKVFELAKELWLLGDDIMKEVVVDKKTLTGKPKSYKTIDDGIYAKIEKYRTFLENDFSSFLEKL